MKITRLQDPVEIFDPENADHRSAVYLDVLFGGRLDPSRRREDRDERRRLAAEAPTESLFGD